ncbi:MAG: hypothetical protein HRT45_12120 [Bdellovibrionales bacterium]|nr:hypothetical protein [Bdellovibrionales bacterium]
MTYFRSLLAISLLFFAMSTGAAELNPEEHCSVSSDEETTDIIGARIDLAVIDCKATFRATATKVYTALRQRCLMEARNRGGTIQSTDIVRFYVDEDGTDATIICGIFTRGVAE